ncbi:MAG: phosphotransferase enzyme family protein [Alphaproteobacteria bacterium]
MLTKPKFKEEEIIRYIHDAYGLNVKEISFLPLGADFNTTVYRVKTSNKQNYFLKLRKTEFHEASVMVPKYLADQGFKQIIPPIATVINQLWGNLGAFKVILYPYVEGHNSIDMPLSDIQWIEFGATMKKFHSTDIPKSIISGIPKEAFSPKWRNMVKTFLVSIEDKVFEELVAAEMALFMKSKSSEILKFIQLAEELACLLQKQHLDYILCHGDIHGWNLLIDKESTLYIVDWDTLIFAPKERDLMFIGAGIWDSGLTPDQEESLFYQGYGQTEIDQDAIAYYRYERIIQDIGEYCEQIFLSDEGGDDRIQSFEYLKSNFLPGGTIERAYKLDKARK